MRTMTEFEFGWVVAFLEGEGTFYSSGGHSRASAAVSAHQVQREPLERLSDYLGVGKILGPYVRRNPKSSPYYVWCARTNDAAEIMGNIRPHMSPKRKAQIDAVLSRHAARRLRDPVAWNRRMNAIQKAMGNPGQKKSRQRHLRLAEG